MNKRIISMVLMALLIALSLYFRGDDVPNNSPVVQTVSVQEQPVSSQLANQETAPSNHKPQTIDQLTEQNNVVSYVQKYQKLPAFYLTKKEARQAGWDAKKGNLCEVLPNRAIGGDHFANREKKLPMTEKRRWFEADLNYHCGHRGADRLLYSSDSLIFVTLDHYKSFQLVN